MKKIPVTIKDVQYKVTGPILDYVHPKTIYKKITTCTIILDAGVPDQPVLERITGEADRHMVQGQHIANSEAEYNQAIAEDYAYREALNQIQTYGFELVVL